MKRMNNIILSSNKSPEAVLGSIREKAKESKAANRVRKQISYKIRENCFILHIPWNIDNREFVGRVYKSEEGTTVEGRFITSQWRCCVRGGFWVLAGIILIALLVKIPVLVTNKEFLVIFLPYIFLGLFDGWHLFFFKSKRYERNIIDFLKKCVEED